VKSRCCPYLLGLSRSVSTVYACGHLAHDLQHVAPSLTKEKCVTRSSCRSLSEQGIAGDSLAPSSAVCERHCRSAETSTYPSASLDLSSSSNNPGTSSKPRAKACSSPTSQSPQTEPIRPPCKLLTLLAENPAADITQVPLPPHSGQGRCEDKEDGVECSEAYTMLMQYSTSEEKMDNIAKALEEGCTPSKGGGCKVNNHAIWSVLDKVTN
jgi:hypothetical protein